MDEFILYIQKYINLSIEAESEIRALALINESVSKGQVILKEGETCERLYFLQKGTARTYHYQKGKDITYWIYPENTMITSWHSYILRKPSSEYIETTEESILISMSYDQWQELYLKYPILERFGRLILEEQMALIDDFFKGYYFLSAKEKYTLLTTAFPSITQRANLGHIASMLGISQETLSRIRGK
ncbi:Crp/Fnr family transcriptional regulator [Maribacter ulvicola]|uniref:cAMP-binding domain of CRP or a regulatory subunit of cAMP-dependent protein kinases n=1 Tax=Maribacter ulvicola TaxID=228959 RepID=A0A1N6V821_9FLAO|nr:Crp/Fnr family transcriptional regulator [Maribacter ulvicola]SIQ73869.1 cAMP-binding domain of CRP or a regulatory subunit of cAMP-dependent protein kinases [Maribacter ulvicola]